MMAYSSDAQMESLLHQGEYVPIEHYIYWNAKILYFAVSNQIKVANILLIVRSDYVIPFIKENIVLKSLCFIELC